jgi:inhibitor of cysteine peptidase
MKRFIPPGIVILLLAVVLTLQLGPGVAAAPGHEASFGIGERTYIADGQIKVIDVVPYIENGRAFIPVRFLASALGIPDEGITWDEAARTVTISQEGKLLKLTIENNILQVDSRAIVMDAVPQLKDGRVVLPARWVAEALGYAVTWNEGSKTVRIAPPGSREPAGAASLPSVGSYENLKSLLASTLQHPGLYGRVRAGGNDEIMVNQEAARESISADASAPAPDAGDAAESMKSMEDYSKTNLQVEGVDEADIVKTDGNYIYQVNRERLIIARAYPAEDMKVVSTLDYGNQGFSPQEIYVDEKHLIVIGHTSAPVARPMDSSSMIYPPYWNRETVKAIIYDIGDKSNVRQVRELELSGRYISSRKIGQSFYLVANKNIYYYPGQEIDEPRPLYRDTAVQDGFAAIDYPDIRCFPDFVEPNYLIVAGLNLDRPEQKASVSSYLGSGQNVYASPENLYIALTNYRYRIMPDEAKILSGPPSPAGMINTSIYRFKLEDGSLTYTGKGEVPGSILNQFSMDEYNNYFRIATTQGESWRSDEFTSRNNLYVLDSDLKLAGKIEGIAPGERIYSVRFTGDRAYMVTFKNVDPFFVLDLSDPQQPEILGALKIPGYSDYLHPYDENHVIGFGKDTVEMGAKGGLGDNGSMAFYLGMKMALFDVTDVKNPVEMFRENIGDRGTDSELLRNHKALLFSKEKNLLAFPVRVMETGNSGGTAGSPFPEYGQFTFQGAYVYSLDLNKGFVLKGRITHLTEEDYLKAGNYWYNSEKDIERILYINENLYTLSKMMIKANRMESLKEAGSLVLR